MRKSSIDIRTSARLKGTALAVALAALSFSVGVQARGLTHPVDPDYAGRVSVTGVAYPGETVTFRRWNTIDEDPNAPQDQQSDETADDEEWVWHPY